MTLHPDPAGGPQVVLHEEHLQVTIVREPVERLLIRRVIVTETRQIEVTVRREELRIEQFPLDAPAEIGSTGAAPVGAVLGQPPLVVVLSHEVPTVQLNTRPYEQITVHVDTVTDQQQVNATLAREQAEVLTTDTGGPTTAPTRADR